MQSPDDHFMLRALELAERGRYTVSPNPMVGCVIVRDDAIIAEGWHHRAGEAHAEVDALSHCDDPRGATMYVTLEPCSHRGRTGPCANAVIEAGLSRVVVAMEDPHDVVNGRGIAALREAGIDVIVGVLEADARRLNEKFLWSITQKLPFVLVKAGMTLDGKLATVARESQWITAEASREASLRLREEFDAIIVGSGTVKADNPRLTRRLGLAGDTSAWTRVVLDGDGDVPPHSQLLTDGGRTILFTSAPSRYASTPNVEIIATEGRIDLSRVLAELHARKIHSVIIEGGALVHSEVIRGELWQKMILFIAPLVVGGAEAPSIFSGEGIPRLTDAHRFRFDRVEQLGSDLMVVAYPA
ncbi:MAG TPA: bifunctional diaminohydroxyphosphoribosylaminopyrimidine deaminase/5-amino-6-(5-phosphoribosylamino)uracil reductase RibD [Thermoanaerobaculia bacterium]|nr:bifunctional diaminohydroxyphosphoribosylaminopyrimidine deaminase/5-amino-6-(5-phosphoribosylamino)uracil reductase RibD [Thermoanaerobaculia bacterium]